MVESLPKSIRRLAKLRWRQCGEERRKQYLFSGDGNRMTRPIDVDSFLWNYVPEPRLFWREIYRWKEVLSGPTAHQMKQKCFICRLKWLGYENRRKTKATSSGEEIG